MEIHDFQLRKEGPSSGMIDLSNLVSVSTADPDRICVKNAFMLQVDGVGRLFAYADSKESHSNWLDALSSL